MAYNDRCGSYDGLGNYSAARLPIALRRSRSISNFDLAYANRCASYYDLGNYSAALADCNQAIALNPKDAWAYNDRAKVYEKQQGQNAAAIADYSQIIALDPKNATAFNDRCWANAIIGQLQAALADLQSVPSNCSPTSPIRWTKPRLHLPETRWQYDNAIADYSAVS